jgi:hypothetical protein
LHNFATDRRKTGIPAESSQFGVEEFGKQRSETDLPSGAIQIMAGQSFSFIISLRAAAWLSVGVPTSAIGKFPWADIIASRINLWPSPRAIAKNSHLYFRPGIITRRICSNVGLSAAN